MSNYSKITDFAAKDSLSTGNPAKIVKGVEIDDELVAISGAIASKADTISETFTGTTTVADLVVGGTASITGAVTISGASSLQAVTATAVVADTLTLDSAIVFEGATEDDYETTITFTDPTADRTITFPDTSGTVAMTSQIAAQATLESVKTGTYSVSGTSVTVSVTAHGYDVGELIAIDFTSGDGVDGRYAVVSKTDNTFTVTHGTSITTSGNVSTQLYTVGTVPLSYNAETAAGTVTTTAVTPASLKYLFTSNQDVTGAEGYQVLPGGLIFLWGSFVSANDSDQAVTFHTEFPSTCLFMSVDCPAAALYSQTKTGFTFNRTDGIDGTPTLHYFAIGV